ncbi:VOC family protein [Hypericibacter sp.]|uniref:VOC family protein n=1 Tax=Hypericibacter sp. TaxID=2705401 RepID=UPI003D6CF1EE
MRALETIVTGTDKTGSKHRTQLQIARGARRASNRIRRLHHHAVRTNDMEATRHFYEDIVGMPLVSALKEKTHTAGRETPFLHCFFEMGDGGCLAFFQFLPDAMEPASNLPPDGIDHHIAMAVPDFDDIVTLKTRFDMLELANCGIDHGFCYSLYVRDPNGMLVEFVSDAENELEINEAAAAAAHDELAKWNSKNYAVNNLERGSQRYPLPTSPVEIILKVVRGDRVKQALGRP